MRTEQVGRVLENFAEFAEVDRDEMDGWTAVALRKI
jgi:pyrroline-5-carboxylate reductase